jgi:short-subunit dehydrogenase
MKKSATFPIFAATASAAVALAFRPRRPRLVPGQVAIITGGSRGLGLALAHRFGRAGLKLALAARHEEELIEARRKLLASGDVANPNDILLVPCDLTDPEQSELLVARTMNTFSRLDVLINNAGIIEVGPFGDQPIDAYYRAMQTNFFAALHTIQAAIPYLLSPPLHGRRAHRAIVNIASIGGKIPVPHMLPYVAAKFALTGFSEGLHAELRFKGVRVTTVCPGLMRTGGENHAHFTGQRDKEERWFMLGAKTPLIAASVTHAANRIYSAVQSGRAEITITPQAWLAARIFGLAPEFSQRFAALANHYLLPDPRHSSPPPAIPESDAIDQPVQPFADPSPS